MVRKKPTLKVRFSLGTLLVLGSFIIIMSCRESSEKAPATVSQEEEPATDPEQAGESSETTDRLWTPYDDSQEVAANENHPKPRMRYKLIQSRILDKNEVFLPLYEEVRKMSDSTYQRLKPLILEQPIPLVQQHIRDGAFGYEDLCRFFLYRIYKYELNNTTTLNTVIALNEGVLQEARQRDAALQANPEANLHPIFGMPVLLKDNINTEGMHTTAGAVALMENKTGDAYIVERLKERGALVLGKVNLSEWAYYFCGNCPVGYSAVGGQTLNPYGRRIYETGGSSSGSGTAMAAGYAMAAVGTETSGSILSPSSMNSIVGLKPVVGMLSRTGIVPISGTLDTPGPMTRNVTDAGILFDAMMGYDVTDPKAFQVSWEEGWYTPAGSSLRGKRLGVFKSLMETDTLYRETVGLMEKAGATIVPFSPPEVKLEGFRTLLNLDMKQDLPEYLNTQIRDTITVSVRSVRDVVAFNREDSTLRMPYGQARLDGILKDTTSEGSFDQIRSGLTQAGKAYLGGPWKAHDLDAILSVNNLHAGYAAVARYPALTVPMGYRGNGEPAGLTFIVRGFQLPDLFRLAYAYEQLGPFRRPPRDYSE